MNGATVCLVGAHGVVSCVWPVELCRLEVQYDGATYGCLDVYIDKDHTVLTYGHIEPCPRAESL